MNKGFPAQANQTTGRGFFTVPGRKAGGTLTREVSSTFSDHWSQPRLFYNSLTAIEQQFLINAMRFETSMLRSNIVKQNVIAQLNRVSHDLASRVAEAIGMTAPDPDPTYYHDNTTAGLSIFNFTLPTIATLRVGVLTSTKAKGSVSQASTLKDLFAKEKVTVTTVGEMLADGVDMTYSAADATAFDGVIVTEGAESLFETSSMSPLYPPGRPGEILHDAYRFGKPVGSLGSGSLAFKETRITSGPGVYRVDDATGVVESFKGGLATFKFVDRFRMDGGATYA
jgi:catalase